MTESRASGTDKYADLLRAIRLHINWRHVTRQLTTEQKNLFADAIDAAAGKPTAERWWSEWPSCAVCGNPVEPGPAGRWLDLRGRTRQEDPVNWAGVGLTPAHAHVVGVQA